MNKSIILTIAACLILGIALILASKINPTTLFVIGIIAVIIGILLTAYVLYQNYKKE